MTELRTPRLLLRAWRASDLAEFAAMNADPEVRRWFPSTQTRAPSDATAERLQAHIATHGFGFWAVEARGVAPFIGFVGLLHVSFRAAFAPAVEAGWRLARAQWRQGYATEAARAALDYGFEQLALDEIVAFTAPGNVASRRTMERLGMKHDPDGDFDHPGIPEGQRHRRLVLYRLRPTAALPPARPAPPGCG